MHMFRLWKQFKQQFIPIQFIVYQKVDGESAQFQEIENEDLKTIYHLLTGYLWPFQTLDFQYFSRLYSTGKLGDDYLETCNIKYFSINEAINKDGQVKLETQAENNNIHLKLKCFTDLEPELLNTMLHSTNKCVVVRSQVSVSSSLMIFISLTRLGSHVTQGAENDFLGK